MFYKNGIILLMRSQGFRNFRILNGTIIQGRKGLKRVSVESKNLSKRELTTFVRYLGRGEEER